MKLSNYAQKCAKLILGKCTQMVGQIGPADGSDELAVLGQSLNSVVHCR